MVRAEERYWRQVPKVNVLHTRRRIPHRSLIFRGLLALILVLGAVLIMAQRSTKADIDDRISVKTLDLGRLQTRLSSQREGIGLLHAEINRLQQEQDSSRLAFELVSGDEIDWFSALSSLFEAQTAGIVLESVTAEPGGRLLLGGLATDAGSKASLPTQLSLISETLDFQSIVWSADTDPPTFAATFTVRQ